MSRKHRIQYPGAIYHVTFRGNRKAAIFKDEADYLRLTGRVAESARDFGVRVYLYCWMTNHGHLLLETPRGNLSGFMRSVLTGYTLYFNRRHGSSGHLMQGRFHSVVVEGDEYLLKLSRYIHLNPIRIRAMKDMSLAEKIKTLRGYRWSSYREYIEATKPSRWLDRAPVYDLLPGQNKPFIRYKQFIEKGIECTDEEFQEAKAKSSLAIGSDGFLNTIVDLYKKQINQAGNVPVSYFRSSQQFEDATVVIEDVCSKLNMVPAEISIRRRDGSNRGILAFALFKRSGLTQNEIADYLGLNSSAAVGYLIRAAKMKAQQNKSFKKIMDECIK